MEIENSNNADSVTVTILICRLPFDEAQLEIPDNDKTDPFEKQPQGFINNNPAKNNPNAKPKAKSGGGGGAKDSPRSEDSGVVVTMGQATSASDTMERLEPEGICEEDSGQNFASFLSVDKRLFGRLQEELTHAQSELKLKEEQVVKLSRIRDDVEREMEDLTASLFQVIMLVY